MNKKHQKLAAGLFFLVLLPSILFAQTESEFTGEEVVDEEFFLFEEIPSVYGASKYEQKVTEAPSSVSIITSEEIRMYGYRTLADIFKSIGAFYVIYDRNYHYVGVRGFGRPGDINTRILLLVDGHRLNDGIYDQAPIGTDFPLDVDLIDRVEVIRGPSSSIYGTNAFFGVVNVITKRGRDLQGLEVTGEIGSLKTQKYRATYGNRFQNGLELFVSGSLYDSEGQKSLYFPEFDDPETNNGIAEKTDDDQSYSFFTKLSFHDFTLQGACSSREKGLPTAPWGIVFNDPRNRTFDERAYVDLKYEHLFSNGLEIESRFFYDSSEYNGNYGWEYFSLEDNEVPDNSSTIILNKDYAKAKRWGAEFQADKKIFEKHKLILGAEFRGNFRQDQRNYDPEPFWEYLNDQRHTHVWALFIQDEYKLFEKLFVNIGLRYDHYETFGGTANPRVALIHSPAEKTTFKLLFGRAFRAPNAFELYYHDGDQSQKANPGLGPEKIWTYELVYEQYIGDHLRLVASGFYYEISDLISQQTDPDDELLVFRNVERIRAKGVEVELEGKTAHGIRGRISLALQDSENETTGEDLTNSPRALVKTNLIVPLLREKIFAGGEVQYTSHRKTVSGGEADGFVMTNLTVLGRNFYKGFELSASVYNLFDEEYGDPGFEEHEQDMIIQDGRTFLLSVTYSF